MTEELRFAKYTSQMDQGQLKMFWDALAEAGIVTGDVPMLEATGEDEIAEISREEIAKLLENTEHVDVVVACQAVLDSKILEILMSQPISRDAPQPRDPQSAPHKRPNGSKSGSGGARVSKADGPDVTVSADDKRVITNVQPNPKKQGSKSFDRYVLYKNGMTVSEFFKAGGVKADVAWDAKRNFITLVTPEEWAASRTPEQPAENPSQES